MRFDVNHYWYRQSLHPFFFFLVPFSWLFRVGVMLRRIFYKLNIFKTNYFPVPVIVVGNLTTGGTGKTPFVIWLAQFLREQGYTPGIVSRGVGGKPQAKPYLVSATDDPREVGDETLVIVNRTHCPMVIGINRAQAVDYLLQHTDCNIVISDDGLQHYSLGRDIEIVIVDGIRYFGNEILLPAGPLREPIKRLDEVDFVIVNGSESKLSDAFIMTLEPKEFISLHHQSQKIDFIDFPRQAIHAMAGIGHPTRFFSLLSDAGFIVTPHVFPDHYHFKPHDLDFTESLPIIMTEKDAVKCLSFAFDGCWYVAVAAKINNEFKEKLINKIKTKERKQ